LDGGLKDADCAGAIIVYARAGENGIGVSA